MDTAAYAEVYARDYIGPMFYYCLKKTGDRNEAEELASDIALAVLHALASYPPPAHFSAWVWKIAHNRYTKWVEGRMRHRERIAGEDIGDFDIADGDTPEEILIESEQYSLLIRELAFIAKEHRELIAAHYIENVGITELSRRLDMPTGTVKTRLMRARKILREGMDMAREFGKRSYAPENMSFAASGNQPDGLPWSAVNRMIPNNILLEASNNPSTAEELAMELGIALPYMEEEIELLCRATLLKKLDGGKYITNFFIADKECQVEIYNIEKRGSKERAELLHRAVSDNLEEIRELIKPNVGDTEFKWTVYLYAIDNLVSGITGVGIKGYFKRPNKGDWGFMGYESHNLISEDYSVNHNCSVSEPVFWGQLALTGAGFKATYLDSLTLHFLGEAILDGSKVDTFSASESEIWGGIAEKYAHAAEDGTVVPDMLVFRDNSHKKMMELISSHPSTVKLKEQLDELFSEIRAVLERRSNPVLHETLNYYVSMFMYGVRGMAVNDAVASGALTMPADPAHSNAGMYMILK
ncbi:MAG: RNA polymerase sigma factor [Clostridia bacterium]|nr:RNA polymerase sigma factor [Clostridia bacterium]